MVNRLPMAKINVTLHRQGWSQRQIAATLGVDRKTVSEHLQSAESKRAKAPTGSDSNWAKAPTSLEEAGGAPRVLVRKGAVETVAFGPRAELSSNRERRLNRQNVANTYHTRPKCKTPGGRSLGARH